MASAFSLDFVIAYVVFHIIIIVVVNIIISVIWKNFKTDRENRSLFFWSAIFYPDDCASVEDP